LLVVGLAAGVLGLLALLQHEALEDVQPVFLLQHALPEVADRIAVLAGRIAGRPIVAAVERQEEGRVAGQLGGHADVAVAHGEMHHRTALEGQQRLAAAALALGTAVHTVLLHGSLHRLGEVGLQLHRGHRDAVDEQRQVDLVGLVQRVAQLRHHAQAVGGVALDHRVVALVLGQALAHRQGAAASHGEAIAQHVHRAALGLVLQLLDQPVEDHRLGAGAVHGAQLGHGLRLGIVQPADHVLGK